MRKLTLAQHAVLVCSATEQPFSGKYWNSKVPGAYSCAQCGSFLFSSSDKFDSGTGWPSFAKAAGRVVERKDNSHGMARVEVACAACGGHLGHVFPDGPAPTGMRYCINSLALEFTPAAVK